MGAASFKSLYLKRPHQSMPLRTVVFGALQIQHYDFTGVTPIAEPNPGVDRPIILTYSLAKAQ